MQTKRDKSYEEELIKHATKVGKFLSTQKSNTTWSQADYLACERALQVLIEAMIGFARYAVFTKSGLKVSKSREAITELYSQRHISKADLTKATKIIGFRNVLVHDYLNLDENVVESIVKKGEFEFVGNFITKLQALLD